MPSDPIDVRYARSGDVSIAYRVIGEGDRDLLFVHGFAGNLEAEAENPDFVKFLRAHLAVLAPDQVRPAGDGALGSRS